MKLNIKRKEFTDKSTIGELWVNDSFFCYTLEDVDRGLSQSDSVYAISQKKKHGITAIPTGEYKVVLSFSNRFKKYLPEILNVKGYAGVRIHSGNTDADSEGCPLVGLSKRKDMVLQSRLAMEGLMNEIKAIEQKEPITLVIE
jgi:hypothetical protein